jgi:TolA-binding protein
VAEVTGTASQDDVLQLRNEMTALQRTVQKNRADADAIGAMEKRLREQAVVRDQQTATLTKRLDSLSTSMTDLSARVEELNSRVDALSRQARTGGPSLAAPAPSPSAPSTASPSSPSSPASPSASAPPKPAPSVATAAPPAPSSPAPPPASSTPSGPSGATATPSTAPPAGATPTARPSTGVLQPSDIYQVAYIDYSKGNYPLAIAGFQEFLRRYPDHELAPNAQYWIGESQVAMARNFTNAGQADRAQQALEQAVVEFKKVLANYPRGDKAPAALYKEALALIELKQPDQAQARLQYLIDNFPQAEETPLARDRLAGLKPGR